MSKSQIIYWIGLTALFICFFIKENVLGYWIVITTLILSSVVYFIEVKRAKDQNKSEVRKQLFLYGISVTALVIMGWFML
jgi:heme O synthase-like polyprenyltransferase